MTGFFKDPSERHQEILQVSPDYKDTIKATLALGLLDRNRCAKTSKCTGKWHAGLQETDGGGSKCDEETGAGGEREETRHSVKSGTVHPIDTGGGTVQ